MKKEDVQNLNLGVYRIYWEKHDDTNSSVGVVGMLSNGIRYLICSNWTAKNPSVLFPEKDGYQKTWEDVCRVELISDQKVDKGSFPEALRIIDELRGRGINPLDRPDEEIPGIPQGLHPTDLLNDDQITLSCATNIVVAALGSSLGITYLTDLGLKGPLKAACNYLTRRFNEDIEDV